MKHVFIINPISGMGNYKDAEYWIAAYFKDRDDDVEIRYTDYPGHAGEIASEYHEDTILYAVGGDGTAHEVLNGMDFASELAIIPVGTGNDFWRMIDQKPKDIEKIVFNTINGQTVPIDIGWANDHYFLNCLNIGVDAEVNRRVNAVRNTKIPRKLVYLQNALIAVFQKQETRIKLTIDGKSTEYAMLLTSVMNGKWYGGGFKSAPLADITDGFLDVTIVDDVPMRKIPWLFPKYYRGTHLGLDVVTSIKTTALCIESDVPMIVGLDGELFEYKRVDIKVCSGLVKFRFPREH